jgi:hypothetical protein
MATPAKDKFDTALLTAMYDSHDTYRAIFDQFAGREKNSRTTKTDRMLKLLYDLGRKADRREVIQFFRNLEKAACGKYVEGRRGHASRFEWEARLSSVGLVAAGKQAKVQPLGDDENRFSLDDTDYPSVELAPSDTTSVVPPSFSLGAGDVSHPFRLRPDKTVAVVLPSDLTPQEAQRLADFVKTLPISV